MTALSRLTKKILLIALLLVSTAAISNPTSASAIDTSEWQAGKIIDDHNFSDADSLSVDQIQAFLNNLVPDCDTYGNQPAANYGRPDLTRAQYATQIKGWPAPPYVCLKNYHEVPKTSPGPGVPDNSFNHGGGAFTGGTSAAQLIYNAAQRYRISPKVLLVKIRAESAGPLTNDSWPFASQYTYAMGAHCPDSGPNRSANCDPNYAGFSIQISEAASLMRYYLDNMGQPWWPYKKPGVNSIQYHPDPTCGSSGVNISSQATAALYTYTPYQPNAETLAAGYGTAPCGAYGNRNFWLYYREWFGSTTYSPPVCNSRRSGVACVWQLNNVFSDSNFLTISNSERDTAISNSLYMYNGQPFYGFTAQQPGLIPVYRFKLAKEHFYTTSESEKTSILQNSSNSYEGVAFYAYPGSSNTNATYPIYRLSSTNGHVFVADAGKKDALINLGYTYEGVAFNTPSALGSQPTPLANHFNVYRLSKAGHHIYTQDLSENDTLLRAGWVNEGVLLNAPVSQTTTPVFRITNGSDHVYTSLINERNQLLSLGWKYEGIAWYVDATTPQTFRFYIDNKHFYTADPNESLLLAYNSTRFESISFGYKQPNDYTVYRMFKNSAHFFTADITEAMNASSAGWKYEGIAWYANPTSTQSTIPVHRLVIGQRHFYTVSDSEKAQLMSAGWKYEGIAWY
ncbi:MAG TPA: hypothetical protein VF575_04780 [Candidatus Saccharimonadales bacterium]